MIFEKATYSYKAIQECIEMVKLLNETVQKKIDHNARMLEVKKVYDFCLEKTGCILFEYEHTPCEDYMKTYGKKYSKKELDSLLRRSINYLKYEINGIRTDMESGEVNVID